MKMKQKIPFAPMPFPELNRDGLDDFNRYVQAFVNTQKAFCAIRGGNGLERLKKWQMHAWHMLEESDASVVAMRDEISTRLACRDLLIAAREIGVAPAVMLFPFSVCSQRAYHTLTETNDGALQLARWMMGRLDSAASLRHGERVRNALFDATAAIRTAPGAPPTASRCQDWLAQWFAESGHEKLRAAFAVMEDMDLANVVDALRGEDLEDGPLSEAGIAELHTAHDLMVQQHEKRLKDYAGIGDRMQRMQEYVTQPITDVLEGETSVPFPALLCWTYAMSSRTSLSPFHDGTDVHRLVLRPDQDRFLRLVCSDWLFWYVGLTSILRQSGALGGDRLKSWGVDILAYTVLHPTKVLRMVVPKDAIQTRSVMAKRVAPALKGYHPYDDLGAALREESENGAASTITLISVYLASMAVTTDGRYEYRNAKHRQLVEYLWANAIGPHCEAILSWMAAGVDLASDSCESVEAEIAALTAWHPHIVPAEDETSRDTDQDQAQPISWFCVSDPRSSRPVIAEFRPATDIADHAFADFLRQQKIKTVIKPGSIARALEFFRDMDDTIRAQTPYDDINGQRWHKLKRGAQRIYVRIESDGRLLFHPYARRDWQPSWVDFAA